MTGGAAITGMGAVTPLGVGVRTLHERWTAGESGLDGGIGRCDDFDPATVLSRRELRSTDRFTQLAVAAVDEALEQAGWSGGVPHPPERVGCVVSSAIGGIITREQQQELMRVKGPDRVSPLGIPMFMPNAAAAFVSMRYGFQGESLGVVGACATGALAIGLGLRMLEHDVVDAVVVGGSEAPITPYCRAVFSVMNAMSPSGVSRPWDRRRDGFVLGEGAGALVLESKAAVERRGGRPVGEVLGYAATSDAHHFTAPEPSGRGAIQAIRTALADADLEPSDLDYVNAHGTSTVLNDRIETIALKSALGETAHRVPVSSTKSVVGHTMGAAGAVEAIATVMALRERVAPPTVGLEEPDDDLDLDYVPARARPLAAANGGERTGISNSFGFGGHNAVLALRAA